MSLVPSGWRPPRSVVTLGVIVLLDLVVDALFAHATRTAGLLSPGGKPHVGVLALGVAAIVLRLAVGFVVPTVAVALGVVRLAERFGTRRR